MDIDKIHASKMEALNDIKKQILDLDTQMNEAIEGFKAKKDALLTQAVEIQGVVKFLREQKASETPSA